MGGAPHTPMCDRRLPCVDLNGIPHLAAVAQPLVVEFIDERFTVATDDVLTFGRRAELVIDGDNQYMHRIVGSFVMHRDTWWLRNDGTAIELVVATSEGRRSQVPPGTAEPLLGPSGVVQFAAGVARYELTYVLSEIDDLPGPGSFDSNATATQQFGIIRLNAEQRLLLAALAERRLVDPLAPAAAMPPNLSVAHRLGWSPRKLDRKLDYLCRRLSEKGVPGLRGEKGQEAVDRRERLVEHVVSAGLIDGRDLDALVLHEGSVDRPT